MNKRKIISDKIIAGSIAGMIGGTIMELLDLILYSLNYLELRAIDFAIILTKQQKATDIFGIISGFLTHLLFAAITGVILKFILAFTDHRFPLLKGASLGFGVNFTFLIGASLFELTKIIETHMSTIMLLFSTAMIHGIITASLLGYFHNKINNFN